MKNYTKFISVSIKFNWNMDTSIHLGIFHGCFPAAEAR